MMLRLSLYMLLAVPAVVLGHGDDEGTHGGHMQGMRPMDHMEHIEHMDHLMGNDGHMDGHQSRIGVPGDADEVDRSISVRMDDRMQFDPDDLVVSQGETIRFTVVNQGNLTHEMVIDSLDELKEHAEMMRENPAMRHVEKNMITLEPGERGEIIWKFTRPGRLYYACLVPGHMESGMIGAIDVE